jgi:hypothetical protein
VVELDDPPFEHRQALSREGNLLVDVRRTPDEFAGARLGVLAVLGAMPIG